jgi:hypothetical protein
VAPAGSNVNFLLQMPADDLLPNLSDFRCAVTRQPVPAQMVMHGLFPSLDFLMDWQELPKIGGTLNRKTHFLTWHNRDPKPLRSSRKAGLRRQAIQNLHDAFVPANRENLSHSSSPLTGRTK